MRPYLLKTNIIDLHFYASVHLLRPELFTPEKGTQAIESHFRYALEDPLMFDSLVSMSRANLTIKDWQSNFIDEKTLQHYGNAVVRLRDVVSAQQSSFDDSVLFAIVGLMNVDVSARDRPNIWLIHTIALNQRHGGIPITPWRASSIGAAAWGPRLSRLARVAQAQHHWVRWFPSKGYQG